MEDSLAEKLLPSPEERHDVRIDEEVSLHIDHNDLAGNTIHVTAPQQQPHHIIHTNNTNVGETQPGGYRDVFCAFLFVAHLLAILYLAFLGFGSFTFQTSSSDGVDTTIRLTGVFWIALVASLLALLLSSLALQLMLRFAAWVVPAGLAWSLGMNVIVAIFCFTQHCWWGMWMGLLLMVTTAWYAVMAWRRMAFSVANLTMALAAVQTNGGVLVVALGMSLVLSVFTVFWIAAWLGVYAWHADCGGSGHCTSHVSGFVILMFLLSYFWTAQVCKNLVHVTVSGVVGTFLFAPDSEADRFWSPAIIDSFVRSTTWSFGSVCLGSLLTALLQLLYHVCHEARRTSRRQNAMLLLCVMECLVGFMERLVAYFNKWAYCYIGLYGYDYLQAGQKVGQLFRDRGWTTLITDDLIQRTLSLTSIGVGLGTGAIGLLLTKAFPGWLDAMNDTAVFAFWLPAGVGLALSYLLLMSVVGAAVDTVIVVFAEAPLELERNHPGLYRQMVAAWRQVYPDEFRL